MEGSKVLHRVLESVNLVFVGDAGVPRLLLAALLAGTHVLIEDAPGTGKTTLVRTVARLTGLSFSRLQFTPDLLPGDVLGSAVWNPGKGSFETRLGPIHCQCLLADELNRGSTRTQAAFLEAMQEAQVSIDGTSYRLPQPFWVCATQNPLEYSGTFELPEAELDRFGISLSPGYPDEEQETALLQARARRHLSDRPEAGVEPLLDDRSILAFQAEVCAVEVSLPLARYMTALVRRTRDDRGLSRGASPRAGLHLQRLAQALAYLDGRSALLPEDVAAVWVPCMRHRVRLSGEATMSGEKLGDVLERILRSLPLPGARQARLGRE